MSSEVVAHVRALVASRAAAPVDAREANSATQILDALDRLPRPLDENADITHLTASCIVVGPRGTVLHLHKRLGLWLQPGGHIDPGEHPSAAAVREGREETGLAVRHPAEGPALVHVDVHAGGRGHRHLDLRYLLLGGDADPVPLPGESPDVRWFGWDDAIAVADPGLAGALRALRP